MDKNELKSVNGSTIVMYTNEDGVTNLDVRLENETVWLSVEQMTILFGRDRTVITRHINKIFKAFTLNKMLQISCNNIYYPVMRLFYMIATRYMRCD